MEGRAWKGFGDWHYPGRSGNGWHGEQGMWWGVRETSWTSQTRGSNTECPPCRTPDRDRPRTARRAHTGAAGRTETRNEGHSGLAGHKAEPVACSVGAHLQLPSIPPCLERDGKRHGTSIPRGSRDRHFPQDRGDQHSCGMIWGSASLQDERDQHPCGKEGPASPWEGETRIPMAQFTDQHPHGTASLRDDLGTKIPTGRRARNPHGTI